MNKKILHYLFLSICFISIARTIALGNSESPASYLSASELLDLYSSMYSSIHNMSVSYTAHVEEAIPHPEQPHAFDNLVRYERVERIEEGDKYHLRSTADPNGFKRSDKIYEYAFDGSVTMEYFARDNVGSIRRGRSGRNVEYKNELLRYMLLTKTNFDQGSRMGEIFPNGARKIELSVSSEGTVRPHLELVSGQWCHVVETHWPRYPKPASITWFAAEKGGLPMKFEQYDRQGKYTASTLLEKITSTDTLTGQIWYPQEGILIFNRNHGTTKNRFTCHELRVNIKTNKDTWKFPFPVGTQVVDRILGIEYVVGSGETPEGEPIVLGTLEGHGITESTTTEAKDSGAHHADGQDMSKTSTEPNNKAEVQSVRETEGPIAVTNTGRKQFGFVAVVLCLSALLACGGGIFLWKRNVSRKIKRA